MRSGETARRRRSRRSRQRLLLRYDTAFFFFEGAVLYTVIIDGWVNTCVCVCMCVRVCTCVCVYVVAATRGVLSPLPVQDFLGGWVSGQ